VDNTNYNSLLGIVPASKGKRMDSSRFLRGKLIPILVNRTAVFFFLMCLVTLFLYGVGTQQGFIDSTQLSLLRLYIALGIFLTVDSAYGVALDLERLLKNKKTRYLFRAGGYFLLVLFGAATVAAVMFIITLSKGNGA